MTKIHVLWYPKIKINPPPPPPTSPLLSSVLAHTCLSEQLYGHSSVQIAEQLLAEMGDCLMSGDKMFAPVEINILKGCENVECK